MLISSYIKRICTLQVYDIYDIYIYIYIYIKNIYNFFIDLSLYIERDRWIDKYMDI